jgi:hypothetical protein
MTRFIDRYPPVVVMMLGLFALSLLGGIVAIVMMLVRAR